MRKKILAVAVTAALSTGFLAAGLSPIFAADTSPEGKEAPAKEQVADPAAEQEIIKVSEDALMSMRDLHSARLSIFNGLPDEARTYVDAAVTRIADTVKVADKYALDMKLPKADDRYIPFDANLTVMDTFVPSDKNAEHIAKANEHLHKGEKKEAIEALKLGDIDVAITASFLPVKLAKERIDESAKLIGEGKYYEANLALKAVDDAVVAQTFGIDELQKVEKKK